MSLSLKISDATFTKYVSSLPPYITLAKAFYLFGGSQAESVKNYANSALPATVLGTPTYSTGYASVTASTDGFDSGVYNTSPFTHIVIVADSSNGVCGNWYNPSANNANLIQNTGTTARLALDSNIRATVTAPTSSGFKMLAATHDNTTASIHYHNGTSLVTNSAAYGASTKSPTAFRVGAGFADAQVFRVAAAMTFQTALTGAQITEIYTYLKALLSTRGITVL